MDRFDVINFNDLTGPGGGEWVKIGGGSFGVVFSVSGSFDSKMTSDSQLDSIGKVGGGRKSCNQKPMRPLLALFKSRLDLL